MSEHSSLGELNPVAPACTPKPRWIPQLKHFFSPKTRGVKTGSADLEWKSSATVAELEPDQLNPGYFFAKNHGLIRDKNLDKKLQELMAKLAANWAPDTNSSLMPNPQPRFHYPRRRCIKSKASWIR